MPTETRLPRGRDAKGRHSPFGALVLALLLTLGHLPSPDAKERDDGKA